MKPLDYLKAAGVGLLVMVLTFALSFPMVFVYATFIEPGHPQAFYNEAALWIAPWSSHIFAPIVFFALNFWLARRRPQRNAIAFALVGIAFYVLIDGGSTVLLGYDLTQFLTGTVLVSMIGKLVFAVSGARLGARRKREIAA